MKALTDGLDLDAYFHKVADAPSRTLLLDYDGTLAPFREQRDEAFPYEGVRDAVRRQLAEGGTRLVIVSGRAVTVLRSLLGVEPPPEMWGSHGWERWTPGDGLTCADPGNAAREGLARALEAARETVPGERVETKPVSVAVHTRGLEGRSADSLVARVRGAWLEIARESGLEVHPFDGGLEMRVPGRDKGTAVAEILAETPDDGVMAYLGDDRTDEDAFAALEPLGERGLRVLVRDELRDTGADLWIRPPDELLGFLERWRRSSRR